MTANITVVYQRYGLDGADAAAYTEFVARARGTHYMQQLGWCVVGADPTACTRTLSLAPAV